MKKIIVVILFCCFYFVQFAQINMFPTLPLKKILFKTTSKKDTSYNCSLEEKKVLLFYDIKSQPLAEAMFNGCSFVYENTKMTVFPILFVGDEMKKINTNVNIQSIIPVQIYRSFEKTEFEQFKLCAADYPIMLFYDEKNHLCGFAKNVEQVNLIDCEVK